MGKVVKLDAAAKERGKSGPAAKQRKTGRRRRSKTALVLGGGGFTGGVYEIGALRALDLLSVNRTVNQFDVYVGTSAGSFVAALTANGVTPEEMMRVVNQQVPTPFRDIDVGTLLRPNLLEFAAQGRCCCRCALRGSLRHAGAASSGSSRRWTWCSGSAEGLPSGVYIGRGHRALHARGALRPRPHRRLPPARLRAVPDGDRPRHLRADRVRRRRAGTTCRSRPPCAPRRRCRWSTSRSRSSDRELVDGGIVSTTNLDIAVEAGAKFVVVVNPLVPVRQRLRRAASRRCAARARGGSRTWASRRSATRRSSCSPTSACTRWPRQWEERYPGVDIVLIEPEPNDELMFQTSIMNFTSRVEIARHGFESVTMQLAEEYDRYQRDLRAPRHRDLGHARAQGRQALRRPRREQTRAWRKILEQTTGALLRQSGSAAERSARASGPSR